MKEHELSPDTLKRIGLIFFILLVLFSLSFLYIVKEFILIKYYPVKVRFSFVGDLKKGAGVLFTGGFRIGYVNKIYRSGSEVEVELLIRQDFSIRKDADVSLFTMGLMGERFVELDQNEKAGEYIAPGTTLVGNNALSLEIFQMNLARLTQKTIYAKGQVIPSFQELMNNLNRGLRNYLETVRNKRPGTTQDIRSFKESTENVLGKIIKTREYIERLKTSMQSINKDEIGEIFLGIRELEQDLNNLNIALKNFIKISQNFKYETSSIVNKENIAGKIIFSKEYYEVLEKDIGDLEDFTGRIADNPNSIFFK